MTKKWFRPIGWLYYPVSWQGVTITLLALLFCLQVFTSIDSQAHSVSDTLYGIFPFWVPTALAWLWIASKSSAT